MKKSKLLDKTVIGIALALSFSSVVAKGQESSPASAEPLVVEAQGFVPTASAVTDPDVKASHQKFIHADLVELQKTLLQRQSFTMELLGQDKVSIEVSQVQKVSDQNVVATGKVSGDPESSVSLAINDGALVGHIRLSKRNESYDIRPAGNGVYVLELNENSEHNCEAIENPVPPSQEEESLSALQSMGPSQGVMSLQSTKSSGVPVLDIMVAYTPQARAKAGGTNAIKGIIQMGITDTNQALIDSGANLRVRLAGTLETRQNERGRLSPDLDALRGSNDGLWDEIHKERQRLGADQVTLVGVYANEKTTGGIGYIRANKSTAFTIVKISNFGMYTFSHELGHNLGLNHDDGYVSPSANFRTIIAYGNKPRIKRFSNPLRKFNGYPTGDSRHNEVSIINQNASKMANLMTKLSSLAKM